MTLAKPEMWYPGINRSHPLMVKIKGAWLFWEGGGLRANDVVNGNFGTIKTASSGFSAADWGGGPRGTTIKPPGTQTGNDELTIARPLTWAGQDHHSVAWGFRTYSNGGANPGVYRDSSRVFWVVQNGNGNFWGQQNSTAIVSAGNGPSTSDGRFHDVVVSWDGVNVRMYWDGSIHTTVAVSTGSDWEIAEIFRQSGIDDLQADFDYFYAWDRAVSSPEAAQLHADPFEAFRPESIATRHTAAAITVPEMMSAVNVYTDPNLEPEPVPIGV